MCARQVDLELAKPRQGPVASLRAAKDPSGWIQVLQPDYLKTICADNHEWETLGHRASVDAEMCTLDFVRLQ